jgi:hypothetical protein
VSVFKLPLPTTLEEARHQATFAYDSAQCWEYDGFDGPDALDRVEKPATQLLQLLDNRPDNINWCRIIGELTGEDDDPSGDRAVAVGDKLDDMLHFLDEVRLAARRAHVKRGRGRPGTKADLRAAYSVLIEYWQRAYPGVTPTNTWDKEDRRIPTSDAACFLFDELRRIDPRRERLAEQLRDLLQETVESSLGPRPGRKVK